MPEWVPLANSPFGKLYLDRSSIETEQREVRATIKMTYQRARTTQFAPMEHWSVIQRVSIRCDEKLWTTLRGTAFDYDGGVLKHQDFDGKQFHPFSNSTASIAVASDICAHVLEEAPLTVPTVE